MLDERELAIHPIVPESVQHNSRVRSFLTQVDANANLRQVVSNIRNITASLFGIVAGTLGLESYPGFAFYLVGTTLVSALLYQLRADGKPQSYFYSPVNDLWMGDITTGIMSFMLTWTLFYGIVRAQ